jgi:hypothetical protein
MVAELVDVGAVELPDFDGPDGVAVADPAPPVDLTVAVDVVVDTPVVALLDVVEFKAAHIFAGMAPKASKVMVSFNGGSANGKKVVIPSKSAAVQFDFAKHGGIKVAS